MKKNKKQPPPPLTFKRLCKLLAGLKEINNQDDPKYQAMFQEICRIHDEAIIREYLADKSKTPEEQAKFLSQSRRDYHQAESTRRRKSRIPKSREADYASEIFKPRLALLPMVIAAGIYIWRFFTIHEVETSAEILIPLSFLVCLFFMAVMEATPETYPKFVQIGAGFIFLFAIIIESVAGTQFFLLLIFTYLLFMVSTVFPYSFYRKKLKVEALTLFFVILAFGGAFYCFSGAVLVNHTVRAYPGSVDQVRNIVFEQKSRQITVSDPYEINRILSAWQLYSFEMRGRRNQEFVPDKNNTWICEINYRNGYRRKYLLAPGLRKIEHSVFLQDEAMHGSKNPFGFLLAYQSPKLYPVLQSLLWSNH